MGHTSKNESQLEKWVTLGKMGHIWKIGNTRIKGHTLKRVSHLNQ